MLLIGMLVGTVTGCYRHVVRAEGPRARQVNVYEPNLKNERIPVVDDLEDAMFGKEKKPPGKTGNR